MKVSMVLALVFAMSAAAKAPVKAELLEGFDAAVNGSNHSENRKNDYFTIDTQNGSQYISISGLKYDSGITELTPRLASSNMISTTSRSKSGLDQFKSH